MAVRDRLVKPSRKVKKFIGGERTITLTGLDESEEKKESLRNKKKMEET